MPQTAAPASDITDGSWTTDTGGTILFDAINEAVASDTDYIQSPALTAGNSDFCEIALASITDPAISTGHVISYRYRAQGTEPMNLVVSLRQGAATEIASWTHTTVGGTYTTATQTLSAGEANAITNYADLRLRFNAICPAAGNDFEWGAGNPIEWGSGNPIQWG